MSGNTQPVTISTNVANAKCTLTNEKGSWLAQAPGSAVVTNSRENLSVRCETSSLPKLFRFIWLFCCSIL